MFMSTGGTPTNRQDESVTKQYDRWARVYDLFWRRYINQTVPVAREAAAVAPGERVIDLACGTGELERRLVEAVPEATIVGVDLAPSMIARSRSKLEGQPRAQFEQADVHDLPFEANTFDVAICANTFHYFTHPERVLEEAARVLRTDRREEVVPGLRPEGRLVVLDWCRDFWTCRVMDVVLRRIDPAYHTCYTLDEITDLLNTASFDLRTHFCYRFDLIWGMMVVEAVPADSA